MGRINEWITLCNDTRCAAMPFPGPPLGSEVSCGKGSETEKKIAVGVEVANTVNPCQKYKKLPFDLIVCAVCQSGQW